MNVIANFRSIVDKAGDVATKCGRNPADIQILPVTKYVSWGDISPLYQVGCRQFGENRVDEALLKKALAPPDCLWHFIGTLQKNKVAKAIGNFALIHSVDSVELARKISEASNKKNLVTKILLQVNTSGELSKHGLTSEQWKRDFERVSRLPSILIEGLMTMAPLHAEERTIHECFANLRKLRDSLSLHHLSMGMSHDFPIAIEEGATILRIGTTIFQ